MKSFFSIIVVGVFLFVLSAGLSWMVIFKATINQDGVAQTEVVPEDEEVFPPVVDEGDKLDVMPVALRPETPVTMEAVSELARTIMKKERALFEAQQQLKKEEKRLDLLFEDLKRERDELSAFGQKVDARIVQAREAVELLKLEKNSIIEQSEALASIEKRTGKTTITAEDEELERRVKVVKGWFKGLDPEQAARYLKEFADRGDIKFAARLLDSLEDRQTAKVLASFNDPPLVAQIIDSFTGRDLDAKEDGNVRSVIR